MYIFYFRYIHLYILIAHMLLSDVMYFYIVCHGMTSYFVFRAPPRPPPPPLLFDIRQQKGERRGAWGWEGLFSKEKSFSSSKSSFFHGAYEGFQNPSWGYRFQSPSSL